MFYNSILLVLALCACAFNVVAQQGKRFNVKVSHGNMHNVTTPDGFHDFEKSERLRKQMTAKYEHNRRNRKANAEREAAITTDNSENGAEIKITASSNRSAIHARNDEPLTNSNGNENSGTMWVGSPSQTFVVQFDTGSADVWVDSIDCNSQSCNGRNKYDISRSSSAVRKSGTFSIAYGDSTGDVTGVSGPIVEDLVIVAGCASYGQTFSPVNMNNGIDGIDGIVGMSYAKLSTDGHTPFFTHTWQQGRLAANEFSFKTTLSDGVLTLGGRDENSFVPPPEFHQVALESGFWLLTEATVYVGGKGVVFNTQTIIDTGTSLIYGPTSDVKEVYSKIPGSRDIGNGQFSIPCNNPLPVEFSWGAGGDKWPVDPNVLINGKLSSDPSQCVGSIIASDDPTDGEPTWLLGNTFITNVYTIFNFAENLVGFAAAADF